MRLIFLALWLGWGAFFMTAEFGAAYGDYARRVARLIPFLA